MSETLTLTAKALLDVRVATLAYANQHAERALGYIARGYGRAAAYSAQLAFQYSRAWHELTRAQV
jgi:hypothetical protein